MQHTNVGASQTGGVAPVAVEVEIFVDRLPKRVRGGLWIVSALKAAVGVDPALVLAILEDGHLRDLEDASETVVVAGNRYFSHARSGSSS